MWITIYLKKLNVYFFTSLNNENLEVPDPPPLNVDDCWSKFWFEAAEVGAKGRLGGQSLPENRNDLTTSAVGNGSFDFRFATSGRWKTSGALLLMTSTPALLTISLNCSVVFPLIKFVIGGRGATEVDVGVGTPAAEFGQALRLTKMRAASSTWKTSLGFELGAMKNCISGFGFDCCVAVEDCWSGTMCCRNWTGLGTKKAGPPRPPRSVSVELQAALGNCVE